MSVGDEVEGSSFRLECYDGISEVKQGETMPVNEYGQMIGESMEGYTSGELPAIDFLEGRYAPDEDLSVEKHGGFIRLFMVQVLLGRCGPTLSGTSGRYGGTG